MKLLKLLLFPTLTSLLYVALFIVASSTKDLFMAFGADLPQLTFVLIQYYPLFIVIPIASIAIAIHLFKSKKASSEFATNTNVTLALIISTVLAYLLIGGSVCYDCNIAIGQ